MPVCKNTQSTKIDQRWFVRPYGHSRRSRTSWTRGRMIEMKETFVIGEASFRPVLDMNDELEGCIGPDGFERCDNCVMQDACPMHQED